MTESFQVEFIGGSRDGAKIDAERVPKHVVTVNDEILEIYERQNDEPPFIYMHVGYAENGPME